MTARPRTILGLGLIDQSQEVTTAAMHIAEKNVAEEERGSGAIVTHGDATPVLKPAEHDLDPAASLPNMISIREGDRVIGSVPRPSLPRV